MTQLTLFDDEFHRDQAVKRGETYPYVRGSDTSREAAESLDPAAMSQLKQIIVRYVSSQPHGATCDEIEVAFELRHQTASARVRELSQAGLLRDSGQRRATRSGAMARVYVAQDSSQ